MQATFKSSLIASSVPTAELSPNQVIMEFVEIAEFCCQLRKIRGKKNILRSQKKISELSRSLLFHFISVTFSILIHTLS